MTTTEKIQKVIARIFIFIVSLIIGGLIYYKSDYNLKSLDPMFYTLYAPNTGVRYQVVLYGFIRVIIPTIIIYFFLTLIGRKIFKKLVNRFLNENQKIKYQKFNDFINRFNILIGIFMFFIILVYSALYFRIFEYNKKYELQSNVYEERYVDPENVLMDFTDSKNLIHIVVESLDIAPFGLKDKKGYNNVVYPLSELAKEDRNYNFSYDGLDGGFYMPDQCAWTIAGITCQTAGVPLKAYKEVKNFDSNFLNGAYALGDVLRKEDYELKFILGSDIRFAKRDLYFKNHGNYQIIDYNKAKSLNYIKDDYKEWWGFEDKKLFEIAKKEVEKSKNSDKKFAITLLTADTHFPNSYLSDSCPVKFNKRYENSYHCTSLMIVDFINWLKEKSYYHDTVVVITGDHQQMANKFFEGFDKYKERYIYNLFLNVEKDEVKEKGREFTAFDIYPSILSAMNVKIDGDRLALGTDLFSNKKTHAEDLGTKAFVDQVNKNSNYYYRKIYLGRD